MSIQNAQKRQIAPDLDGRAKRIKHDKCPACNKAMNLCKEEEGLWYCPECAVHVRNGQICTTDPNGEFEPPLGHVNKNLRLVKDDQSDPYNIDVWFSTGIKKCFRGLTGHTPKGQWIILTKADGKEISINANNVNYIEEV